MFATTTEVVLERSVSSKTRINNLSCLFAVTVLNVGCVNEVRQEFDLEQTWLQGTIVHPGENLRVPDTHIQGFLGWKSVKESLAAVSSEKKYPVVVYLHGCSGADINGIDSFVQLLRTRGFVTVAPNSFARTNHPGELCFRQGYQNQIWRHNEARYAVRKLRQMGWADMERVFLVGFSEGGGQTARYAGSEFSAHVILGANCWNGVNVGVPTLAIWSIRDPAIEVGCRQATHSREIAGSSHQVLGQEDPRKWVTRFLEDPENFSF